MYFCVSSLKFTIFAKVRVCLVVEQGWPNHCPGAKKCPPNLFHVPSKLFFENYILLTIFRNLQNLILKYTTKGTDIELDMV